MEGLFLPYLFILAWIHKSYNLVIILYYIVCIFLFSLSLPPATKQFLCVSLAALEFTNVCSPGCPRIWRATPASSVL